jgi:broad specificity phosphatase PhoE
VIHPQGRPPRRYLVRHGETEWSLAGRHTGRTDLPVTAEGGRQADRLLPYFRQIAPSCVLTSPLERARQTCRAAGLAESSSVDADLAEWDYGDYEGRSTADIHRDHPVSPCLTR